ncbi:DEAD/DEAH box helicase [uncultured Ruminococcus sp.]|uniref:DEAD/DEAH box helicase n=1 Tax=uncultured Ruminococcus sp. TaxID=165186 RepID=UPI00262F2F13|nr:DEAD/DEAH box helicase [uncultured Ruminococcus sp.]
MKISVAKELPVSIYHPRDENRPILPVPVISGDGTQYLSDILPEHLLTEMQIGTSVLIHAPVGSGKTTALIKQAVQQECPVLWVTNRKALAIQTKKAILTAQGMDVSDWPSNAIGAAHTGRITVTTYQAIAAGGVPKLYHGSVCIFDEIHYLLNDAVFSTAPMLFRKFLRSILSKTKRIYISATAEEVAPLLWKLEQPEQTTQMLYTLTGTPCPPHLQQCFTLQSDWSHLQFRYYSYGNAEQLTEKLREIPSGEKTVLFVRNKERGAALKELLPDSAFVYSSEEESEVLEQIARTEQFAPNTLVSTKVLENGVSMTEEAVRHIVIEEIDPIAWMQFLGRVRNKRKHPRTLTVWIPDYTAQELSQYRQMLLERIQALRDIRHDFHDFLRHPERLQPWMIHSNGKTVRVNDLALIKLEHLADHVDCLLESQREEHHAHIRFLRQLLHLSEQPEEQDFLDYDDRESFCAKVRDAYDAFLVSPKYKADRDALAQALISAVRTTNVYGEKITSSNIQLGTMQKILHCAGIEAKISSLGEAFAVEECSC